MVVSIEFFFEWEFLGEDVRGMILVEDVILLFLI